MELSFFGRINLNKKFSWFLAILSLFYLFFGILGRDFIETNMRIFVFFIGAMLTYPPVNGMWLDVIKYWNKKITKRSSYKDLFYKKLNQKERSVLISHHWKNVIWVVPYFLLFFAYLTFVVSWVFGPNGLMLYFAGSMFGVSVISVKYQEEIRCLSK